ncbi:MAG: pyridoxamine 5'-phosphate oxidase [Bacteroidales bacterium]|nr:MAG: pyridoxamine 5'-phosphate oxidase [Bacteroidales bacterium]
MDTRDISSIRKDYTLRQLDESEVDESPIVQFGAWFDDALKAEVAEPNAMVLATTTTDGRPSARVVLLKGFDEKGFSFFTNYQSRKAAQLEQNPFAALVFFWPELERQIRIEGLVSKVSEQESDEYFNTRPEGSRLGAWVSPQSQVIHGRNFLESLKVVFDSQFGGKTITRPKNWGGYRLVPTLIEFWQGRPSRLHDRIQYTLVENKWNVVRLAP